MDNKSEAMRREYGSHPGRNCRDCCNLIERRPCGVYHYYKCAAYGMSHSTASDWRVGYPACGLFGKNFADMNRKPLLKALKHRKRERREELDPDQTELEV